MLFSMRRFILLFCVLCAAWSACAQSIVLEKHPIGKSFLKKLDNCLDIENPDSAISCIQLSGTYGSAQQIPDANSFVLEYTGYIYFDQNDWSKALESFHKAWNMMEPLSDPEREFSLINAVGSCLDQLPSTEENLHLLKSELKRYPSEPSLVLAVLHENIGFAYQNDRQYDSVEVYFRNAIQMYKAIGELDQMEQATVNLASGYAELGDHRKSIRLLDSIKTNYENSGKASLLAPILFNLGVDYKETGMYEKGLNTLLKAYQLAAEEEDSSTQIESLKAIGNLRKAFGQYDKATEFLERAYQLAVSSNQKRSLTGILNDLGLLALEQGNLETAERQFKKAIAGKSELGDSSALAHPRQNLGRIKLSQDSIIEAEKLFLDALTLFINTNDREGAAETYCFLSRVELSRKNLVQASRYLDQAAEQCKPLNLPKSDLEILLLRYEISAEKGEYDLAISYRDRYDAVRDSVHNEELAKELLEIDARYRLGELSSKLDELEPRALLLDNQLKAAELEKSEADAAARKRELIIIFLMVVLLFAAAMIFLLFRQNNYRKRTNEQLAAQKKKIEHLSKERMKELKHRVQNSLQMLSSSVALKVMSMHDGEEKEVAQSILSRINRVNEINSYLNNPSESGDFDVSEIIGSLVESMSLSYENPDAPVQVELLLDPIKLDSNRCELVSLLTFELVANSYKHAFADHRAPMLQVGLSRSNGSCTLSVKDNGPGFNPNFRQELVSAGSDSLGWTLIGFLSDELNGEIEVGKQPGGAVSLSFPV